MTGEHVLNEISQTIAEITDVTAADLSDDLLTSDKPLVLRGLASDWPAVKHGLESADRIIEYLQEFDSGNVVTALYAPPEAAGRIFYNEDMTAFNFEYRRMALKEAVRQVRSHVDLPSPPSLYVGSTNIDHWLPGFREQNDLPIQHLAPLASIWIGNQSRVSAHYDFPANIACYRRSNWRIFMLGPWTSRRQGNRSAWWTSTRLTTSASRNSARPSRPRKCQCWNPVMPSSFPACGGIIWKRCMHSTYW